MEAGQAETIELELKAIEVKSSVTVTASEEDSKQPAPSASVDERTLRDAPNATDRFENALPLLPGVVRGPDRRINLKGGRATQSGVACQQRERDGSGEGQPRDPIYVVSSESR